MDIQTLIRDRKDTLRRDLKGFDNTLKLKGKNSFVYLLDYLDSNDTEGLDDFNTVYNKGISIMRLATMQAQRAKNKRAFDFINNQTTLDTIWESIKEYRSLNANVYTITDESLAYYNSKLPTYEEKLRELVESYKIVTGGKVIGLLHSIVYNGKLYKYSITPCNKEENLKDSATMSDVETLNIEVTNSFAYNSIPMSTYNYKVTIDFNTPTLLADSFKNLCSNKNCVFHKTSRGKEYNDGAKDVFCTIADCNKCEAFKNEVKPEEVLNICQAVLYAKAYREKNPLRETVNTPSYQPIPLPESNKDVVIYIDKIYDEMQPTKVKVYADDYIPGTHASPREHMRRGTTVHRKNGTVFERKGGIVNKGHTKTNYIIKTRNKTNNKEAVSKQKAEKSRQKLEKQQKLLDELLNYK